MSFRFRALVEDQGHEMLLRGLLDRTNAARSLYVTPPPGGRGAGEQHVRRHFPAFVKDLRTKRNQQTLWGIVVVDGDTIGAQKRRAELMGALLSAGLSPLTNDDRVLLLLPVRNVETWAWCLLDNTVDEFADFKSMLVGTNLRKTFCEGWLPQKINEPPSLIAGRQEWARLV